MTIEQVKTLSNELGISLGTAHRMLRANVSTDDHAITVKQAARVLGIAETTMRRLIGRGELGATGSPMQVTLNDVLLIASTDGVMSKYK